MTWQCELTDAERLEWESRKYSPNVAQVYCLESGRFVVATGSLHIERVCELEELPSTLADIARRKIIDDYLPPKARKQPPVPLISAQELDDILSNLNPADLE